MKQWPTHEERRAIRRARQARKSARTKMRNAVRALGEPMFSKRGYVPEIPANGIVVKWDALLKHERHIVVHPNAWDEIRERLDARCHGKCEGCGTDVDPETFHLHHIKGRGAGKKCECDDCLQVLCPSNPGTGYIGCHDLAHKGRLGAPYRRPA